MSAWAWGSEPLRHAAAAAVVLLYVLLCAGIVVREVRRQRRAARLSAPAAGGAQQLLIAYASQTGFAEQLAAQTAAALHTAGVPARLLALSQLTAADLQNAERALFIVSTCGEGDAPDNATLFVRRLMADAPPLPGLHYGLLSLGDREYTNYGAFGLSLDAWLARAGATPLFERIDVDNADPAALADWRHRLSHLAGTTDLPDWEAPAWQPWTLAVRRLLNPGSAGGPVFHLELAPADGVLPDWESGDLVQVLAPADPDRPREYSIASIHADGRVHLLVRQEQHADGTLGVASGWLTAGANLGDVVQMRLRAHANFRLGDNLQRPMLLIGNGTGLAGLRGHLRARAAAGAPPAWLVFGERQSAHDHYHAEEIDHWLATGVLARADHVFSRDQPERLYVQDRLRAEADAVRAWLARGAAVYVCGSLEGMAAGVDAALVEIAGADGIEQLMADGRYRRDVY